MADPNPQSSAISRAEMRARRLLALDRTAASQNVAPLFNDDPGAQGTGAETLLGASGGSPSREAATGGGDQISREGQMVRRLARQQRAAARILDDWSDEDEGAEGTGEETIMSAETPISNMIPYQEIARHLEATGSITDFYARVKEKDYEQFKRHCESSGIDYHESWIRIQAMALDYGLSIRGKSRQELCRELASRLRPSTVRDASDLEMRVLQADDDILENPEMWPSCMFDAIQRRVMCDPVVILRAREDKGVTHVDHSSHNNPWLQSTRQDPITRDALSNHWRRDNDLKRLIQEYAMTRYGINVCQATTEPSVSAALEAPTSTGSDHVPPPIPSHHETLIPAHPTSVAPDTTTGVLSADGTSETYVATFGSVYGHTVTRANVGQSSIILDGVSGTIMHSSASRFMFIGALPSAETRYLSLNDNMQPLPSSQAHAHPYCVNHASVLVPSNLGVSVDRVVSCGGYNPFSSHYYDSVIVIEVWNNGTGVKAALRREQQFPRVFGHAAVCLSDSTIVVIGGTIEAAFFYDGLLNDSSTVWHMNIDTTPAIPEYTCVQSVMLPQWAARCGHCAVALPNDDILLIGGLSNANQSYNVPFSGAWAHNDVWRSTDRGMSWERETYEGFNGNPSWAPWPPRFGHCCAYDAETNCIYMTGGRGAGPGGEVFGDTWKYDVVTRTWTDVSHKFSYRPRYHHSMNIVQGGRLAVMGGRSSTSSELNNVLDTVTISTASVSTF